MPCTYLAHELEIVIIVIVIIVIIVIITIMIDTVIVSNTSPELHGLKQNHMTGLLHSCHLLLQLLLTHQGRPASHGRCQIDHTASSAGLTPLTGHVLRNAPWYAIYGKSICQATVRI